MTNHDFAHLMRRMWGWLAVAGSITTAVMALLLTVGVLDTSPLTGTGMGLLGRLADEFDDMAEHWENVGDEARASVYTMEKSNLHKRAIQLDGGTR
jgi:hypothetical protein